MLVGRSIFPSLTLVDNFLTSPGNLPYLFFRLLSTLLGLQADLFFSIELRLLHLVGSAFGLHETQSHFYNLLVQFVPCIGCLRCCLTQQSFSLQILHFLYKAGLVSASSALLALEKCKI